MERVRIVRAGKLRYSSDELRGLLEDWRTDYLLITTSASVDMAERAPERLVQVAEDTGAGIVYADLLDRRDGQVTDHPLIDYQPGSIRDSFDFGSFLMISRSALDDEISRRGPLPASLKWGALYDL